MKLSVVTISYNSIDTIEKCIQSIFCQLTPNVEHLVVDGGSNDGTTSFLESFKGENFQFISEPDKGISDAFNKGVNLARGEYIWFVNSDDWLAPNAIKHILNYIEQFSISDVICGRLVMCDGENDTGKEKIPRLNDLSITMSVFHPATIMRKVLIEKIGYFSESKKIAMDYDLLLRAQIAGADFQIIEEILTYFRHGGISTVSKKNKIKSYWECLQSNLSYNYKVRLAIYSFFRRTFRLLFPRFFYQLQSIRQKIKI